MAAQRYAQRLEATRGRKLDYPLGVLRKTDMLPILAAITLSTSLNPPKPINPLPHERQLEWHQLEQYAFIHFGPNTFTGEEWGKGTEDPKIFNPLKFDAKQWVETLKAGGMEGIIITAKHHDGFCLWPSKFSKHTVAQSPWLGGKGDVLKELSKACAEGGIKFGVYLSPWDRNHPSYGTAEYNKIFAEMLKEVLTKYGPVFEVWFDGANGEGPNGKRQEYDWKLFVDTVRRHQPKAVIFSDAGPDIRWIGNENGYAGETNWALLNRDRYVPGTPLHKELTEGQRDGTHYVPGEADVSIRPGWFWRASEDAKVKTVPQLLDIYFASVGRGSNLLLNVPPNSDGLISDVDATRLREFQRAVRLEFAAPARPKTATSDAAAKGFEADKAVDRDERSYWAAPEGTTTASLTVDLAGEQKIDKVVLQEPVWLGQRIAKFEVDVQTGGAWKKVGGATTVGYKRIVRFDPVTASAVRIRILDARAAPALSDVRLYAKSDRP